MSYTRRQQQLLTAMGFVPWVQRGSGGSTQDAQPNGHTDADVDVDLAADVPLQGAANSSVAQVSDGAPTFASRPLCSLANGFSIGHTEAPLLVVVETHELLVTAPLVGDAAQLFEQMMRSIDVTRGSVCQCAVPAGANVAEPGQATVSSLVSIHRAAGILLTHEFEDVETASAHVMTLPVAGRNALPMWRIPHPDILLTQPLKKRQAWQALKAVRQILQP